MDQIFNDLITKFETKIEHYFWQAKRTVSHDVGGINATLSSPLKGKDWYEHVLKSLAKNSSTRFRNPRHKEQSKV